MATTTGDIRDQIHDALLRYCRGVDRLDPDSVTAAFHPGARLIDYRPEPMTIEEFAPGVVAALARYSATQHRVSNVLIELDDDEGGALVESYTLAFHVEPGDDGDRLQTFSGRYIDRFEPRDGAWRIVERTLRVDWTRVEPIVDTMGDRWVPSGRGGSPDPIYP